MRKDILFNRCSAKLILITMIATFMPEIGHAQEKCATELAAAETRYREGRLDEAIDLLAGCLKKSELGITEFERVNKLLSKAYQSKDEINKAKSMLRNLLERVPDWQPDPELDAPSFQRLAEEVIDEFQQKGKHSASRQENGSERNQINISIGGGISVPLGSVDKFSNDFKNGFNLGVSAEYFVTSNLSLGGNLSYHFFDSKSDSTRGGNFNIFQIIEMVKYYLKQPKNSPRLYFLGGLGVAFSRLSEQEFDTMIVNGANGNDVLFVAGLGIKISFGSNYHFSGEVLFNHILIDHQEINKNPLNFLSLKFALVF